MIMPRIIHVIQNLIVRAIQCTPHCVKGNKLGSNTTYLNEKRLKIVHSHLLYIGFEALNEAVRIILPLFRNLPITIYLKGFVF